MTNPVVNFNRDAIIIKQGQATQAQKKSVEDLLKDLKARMDKTDGMLTELMKHMSQLAVTVNELKDEKGKLPSQTVLNPKGNVSTMTLRNGKEIEGRQKKIARI